MLVTHVYPEFNSPLGYMRARVREGWRELISYPNIAGLIVVKTVPFRPVG